MSKFLTILVIIAAAFLAVAAYQHPAFLSSFWIESDMPIITFNEKAPLRVTVVSESRDLQRGLSGRESLGPTEGMLFVFPADGYHGIWMKDMRFPIDIIWVDARGVIVDIAPAVRPDTYPKTFEPKVPARFVIETNAHYAESLGIQVGDSVQIPKSVFPDASDY